MRLMLSDAQWELLAPLVEQSRPTAAGTKPELSERMFLEALLYWARTGVPWRDLPGEFGAWDAVYNRFRRWVHTGRLQRLFELLTAQPGLEEVRRALVDSAAVRAHAHAAGARRKESTSARTGRRGGRRWGAAAAGSAAR